MLDKPARNYLFHSQIAFWLTMVVCILIDPVSLSSNGGISYFGHHRHTVIPFELGLILTVYFLIMAERAIRQQYNNRLVYSGFILITSGLVGLALSPPTINVWMDLLHSISGTLVFLTQALMSAWLIYKYQSDLTNYLLYGMLIVGGLIALIYMSPVEGFEIQGQLIFQLGFSLIMLRLMLQKPKNS